MGEAKGHPAALGRWTGVHLQAPAVLPSQGQIAACIYLQAAGWGICPTKPLCMHCSQHIAYVQDMLKPCSADPPPSGCTDCPRPKLACLHCSPLSACAEASCKLTTHQYAVCSFVHG